jgi:uncharacterized lipoprotein
MKARRRLVLAMLPLAAACVPSYRGAPATPPRSITDVQSSFGRAWDATIDVFGERNIPIKQLERASGFISTDPIALTREDQRAARGWASCSHGVAPDEAVYNVIVRGDSTQSTVKVTVKWQRSRSRQLSEPCTSNRTWELCAEDDIKARAERQPPMSCQAAGRRRGMGVVKD